MMDSHPSNVNSKRKANKNNSVPPSSTKKLKEDSSGSSKLPNTSQNPLNIHTAAHSADLRHPVTTSDLSKDITSKVKPIIANISPNILITYIKSSQTPINSKDISIASISSNSLKKVRIVCTSPEIKTKIINLLDSKAVSWHSFTETADKNQILVLKGFDTDLPEDEILEELKSEKIPAIKVTTIVKSSDERKAVHLVHIARESVNLSTLNTLHRRISFFKVRWENQRKDKKRHSQCHRCQSWGHGSSNCRYPARCVKCAGQHETKDCLKTRETNPTCANCGKNHTANFRGCEQAKSYADMIKRQQLKPRFTTPSFNPNTNNPWAILSQQDYDEGFPSLARTKIPAQHSSAQSRLIQARQQPNIRRKPSAYQNNTSEEEILLNQEMTDPSVSFTSKPKVSPELHAKLMAALEKLADIKNSSLNTIMETFVLFIDAMASAPSQKAQTHSDSWINMTDNES